MSESFNKICIMIRGFLLFLFQMNGGCICAFPLMFNLPVGWAWIKDTMLANLVDLGFPLFKLFDTFGVKAVVRDFRVLVRFGFCSIFESFWK